jgi:hypothetical protein
MKILVEGVILYKRTWELCVGYCQGLTLVHFSAQFEPYLSQ